MDAQSVTIIGSVLVAFISTIGAIISGRKKASADVQTVVNAGFELLIKTLQDQSARDRKSIDEYRDKLEECQRHCTEYLRQLREAGII